jgi:hypothetical protein
VEPPRIRARATGRDEYLGAPPRRSERRRHAAHGGVWTGTRMIVWGGRVSGPPFSTDTGGQYDPGDGYLARPPRRSELLRAGTFTPSGPAPGWSSGEARTRISEPAQHRWKVRSIADTWLRHLLVGAPSSATVTTTVWAQRDGRFRRQWCGAGRQVQPNDGHLGRDRDLGAPAGGSLHTAVWTGTRMIVWGGGPSSTGSRVRSSGKHVDLDFGRAHHPADRATAVWTGSLA